MENIIKFPIGTEKAAEILKCSERTVKRHCQKLKINRLNDKKGPYLIFENDIENLRLNIQDSPGRPIVYQTNVL